MVVITVIRWAFMSSNLELPGDIDEMPEALCSNTVQASIPKRYELTKYQHIRNPKP